MTIDLKGAILIVEDHDFQRRTLALMLQSLGFGHILEAYEYGAPNHGGIAVGFDRTVMLLANEENIREVIAFPVTSSGTTSVMQAPREADPKLLKELHIKVDPSGPSRT